jgi:two-component system, chemotaxis family, chemotaxis protein CheV
MTGVLDGVDRRTRLAGHNRLELLLFKLTRRQRYGINVFKVQEVIQCPALTAVPHSNDAVRGVANLRGKTISIIDLRKALGGLPLTETDLENSYVIITEYNRNTQGFLVQSVDCIVNLNWDEILPPPREAGNTYMTAVTRLDDEIIEIIDVEKVLAEVMGGSHEISQEVLATQGQQEKVRHILVVDDSSVARNQIKQTLDQLGIESTLARNGKEGLEILKNWAEDPVPVAERICMVISDVEMPQMDGYTFTTEIRQDPRLADLYIIMHTSLSGVFNNALVDQVGANRFIPKFKPDELASAVLERLKTLEPVASDKE